MISKMVFTSATSRKFPQRNVMFYSHDFPCTSLKGNNMKYERCIVGLGVLCASLSLSSYSYAESHTETEVAQNAFLERSDSDDICPPRDFVLQSVIPDKFYRAEYDPENKIWDAATEHFIYNGRNWTFHVFDYSFYGEKSVDNAMESAQTVAKNSVKNPKLSYRSDLPALYRCTYYSNRFNGLSIFTLEY